MAKTATGTKAKTTTTGKTTGKTASAKPAKAAAKAAPAKPAKAAAGTAAARAAKPAAPAREAAPPPPGPGPGDVAPAFSLPASGGRTASSDALKGKPYVLYFYPKADTPGCTREACDFNEALAQFRKAGLDVIGVSPDPIRPIEKFAQKFNLDFPLASDEDHKLSEAYGVWVSKSMYGRTYMGIERSTFLVGPDGRIVRAWRKVSVPGHAAEVLAAAKAL
jgi:peroxiredoxin Q/BCP